MEDYSKYSSEELEQMKRDNDSCLDDPYEQNKWVEKEQNEEIRRELEKRR